MGRPFQGVPETADPINAPYIRTIVLFSPPRVDLIVPHSRQDVVPGCSICRRMWFNRSKGATLLPLALIVAAVALKLCAAGGCGGNNCFQDYVSRVLLLQALMSNNETSLNPAAIPALLCGGGACCGGGSCGGGSCGLGGGCGPFSLLGSSPFLGPTAAADMTDPTGLLLGLGSGLGSCSSAGCPDLCCSPGSPCYFAYTERMLPNGTAPPPNQCICYKTPPGCGSTCASTTCVATFTANNVTKRFVFVSSRGQKSHPPCYKPACQPASPSRYPTDCQYRQCESSSNIPSNWRPTCPGYYPPACQSSSYSCNGQPPPPSNPPCQSPMQFTPDCTSQYQPNAPSQYSDSQPASRSSDYHCQCQPSQYSVNSQPAGRPSDYPCQCQPSCPSQYQPSSTPHYPSNRQPAPSYNDPSHYPTQYPSESQYQPRGSSNSPSRSPPSNYPCQNQPTSPPRDCTSQYVPSSYPVHYSSDSQSPSYPSQFCPSNYQSQYELDSTPHCYQPSCSCNSYPSHDPPACQQSCSQTPAIFRSNFNLPTIT